MTAAGSAATAVVALTCSMQACMSAIRSALGGALRWISLVWALSWLYDLDMPIGQTSTMA